MKPNIGTAAPSFEVRVIDGRITKLKLIKLTLRLGQGSAVFPPAVSMKLREALLEAELKILEGE